MMEHFELVRGWRSSLPAVELCHDRVIKLRNTQPTEFDRSKFIRLSSKFPDLQGPQLEALRDICLAAHWSEDFFLSVSRNQWVRTVITCDRDPEDLFSTTSIEEERYKLISSISIHSNVLPYDPFWTKFQAIRDEALFAIQRMHFPSSILKDALQEGKTLMTKLLEWRNNGEACEIGNHGLEKSENGDVEQQGVSKLFWEIRADVNTVRNFAKGSDGTIWLVTWRGGKFVRKDCRRTPDNEDRELAILEMLSHPHIVYSFGVSYGVDHRSLFMEYMQNDLFHFIIERLRRMDGNKPPFLHQDSVDILLQVAKAMAHMHDKNVVHGDLKSLNILISEIVLSEAVKHYLVKIADFGSARLVDSIPPPTGFKPGPATIKYAAPEVLKKLVDKTLFIDFPFKIDVYSFGIIAYEVLTGEELYKKEEILKVEEPLKKMGAIDLLEQGVREMGRRWLKRGESTTKLASTKLLKKGVIEGILRPPLRTKCQAPNFLYDEQLILLIESCWHSDPSKRPSFPEINGVLDSILARILEPMSVRNNFYPKLSNP